MVQIYFLLVLSNFVMGVILAKNFLGKKFENFSVVEQLFSSELIQVTIGCIGTIVGLLALFLRYSGNMIILGDLIPAICSIIAGITLFIEYISHEENSESVLIIFIKNIFLNNRTLLGFILIAASLVHFIAPSIEFL